MAELFAGLTVLAYVCSAIVLYYLAVFILSLRTNRRAKLPRTVPGSRRFVILVPARDEELVIERTVQRLRELRSERYLAIVMNDGSSDRTSELARAAAQADPRIVVVDRSREVAGQGKHAVLNHGYRIVRELVRAGDERLGADPADVIIGCVDADGWLEPHALREVDRYFAEPDVAGVQLPVRMWNATDGFLALMQDIEFAGFCRFVQAGRDPFGSVGLGGNGQFVRLAALMECGDDPWTPCLTEDLDISMTLLEKGWRMRFCPRAAVAQQAITSWRPLFRQRARWVQGHYQCWRHVWPILRARQVPLGRRLDAALFLLEVALVLVFFALLVASGLAFLGVTTMHLGTFEFVRDPWVFLGITVLLTLLPLLCVIATYRAAVPHPVPWWSIMGIFLIFTVYGYSWAVPATLRAFWRIALGKDSWAKTRRVAISDAALHNEAHALSRLPAA